jgi:hypothetical protein
MCREPCSGEVLQLSMKSGITRVSEWLNDCCLMALFQLYVLKSVEKGGDDDKG